MTQLKGAFLSAQFSNNKKKVVGKRWKNSLRLETRDKTQAESVWRLEERVRDELCLFCKLFTIHKQNKCFIFFIFILFYCCCYVSKRVSKCLHRCFFSFFFLLFRSALFLQLSVDFLRQSVSKLKPFTPVRWSALLR